MSCPDCVKGYIIDGTPSGVVKNVDGVDAYFVSGVTEPTPKKFGVILLTDAFGLELVNSKLIADRVSKALACDVWVPDLFDGQPMFKPDGLEPQLLPSRPGPWPVWNQIRFYILVLWSIRRLIRARPSVVVPRTAEFIKTVREQNAYGNLGAVGYCFGGGIAVELASLKAFDSMVLCHPSALSDAAIKGINIPTAWVCAEEDITFTKDMRLKAEATFAARKDQSDFVSYEFVDYKGTAHGFACRPNLDFEEIKAGFEGALSQTVEWFRKTLTS